MGIDLSVIWFVIIVFATLMYIVMDGFDLGIGILFPFINSGRDRDTMMNTVAPVWDGNETWMVLGGAALYGAFPLAYSVILDGLSVPLTAMLLGLIFRGVAFEFRFKATPAHRPLWDKAFIGGSILTALSQGVAVGALLNGLPVAGRAFSGSSLAWLAPFPLFCAAGDDRRHQSLDAADASGDRAPLVQSAECFLVCSGPPPGDGVLLGDCAWRI